MSVFVIIVKQLDTFKYFSESKFDINPDKLVLMIYSVEDYKIVVSKNYKLKTNTAIIKDIYNEVHTYLEGKKVFIVVITACTKIEGFKQLSDDNKDEIEEEEEKNISTPEKKDNIKYNDPSKIFPLSFIIIILVILIIIISIFFVFKNSKRFKKLTIPNPQFESISFIKIINKKNKI